MIPAATFIKLLLPTLPFMSSHRILARVHELSKVGEETEAQRTGAAVPGEKAPPLGMAESGWTAVLSLTPGLGPLRLSAHLHLRGASEPLALPEFPEPRLELVIPCGLQDRESAPEP